MRTRRHAAALLGTAALGGAWAAAAQRDAVEAWLGRLRARLVGRRSVGERLAEFDTAVLARLQPHLAAAGWQGVPAELALLAFKQERRVELHGRDAPDAPWRPIRRYPIHGASGGPGPKLREGDRQVPEGVYSALRLNPNSRFHVSIALDYPNAFDRRMATNDGRTDLGGDIMVHGTTSSIGCLAMGNRAAEELFALAAWVGCEHLRVVICPADLRRASVQAPIAAPPWTATLYAMLRSELSNFPSA